MTEVKFKQLGLSGRIQRALDDANYKSPTPIQAKAIPLLLERRDLLGIAQTGTGKTAAFTLPLLHNLAKDNDKPSVKCARALILAPTRELVIQISGSLKTYGRHMKMQQAIVMGGVGQRPQVNAVRRGVDILLATPGRLLDLINQKHLDLSRTEYLILDEADRMLDMGFIKDVQKIISHLPEQRQTLLFSATMPPQVAKLASDILDDPKRVEIAAKTVAVDRIGQSVMHMPKETKRARLMDLMADPHLERVIVFTRTRHGADKVVKHLDRGGVKTAAIHGNKSQGARQRSLDAFRKGQIRVLVATDIASRGIDIDHVTHVINFELPNEPESYVHRIGRTARAGAAGIAISFCEPSERAYLQDIEKLIKRSVPVIGDAPTDDIPAKPKRKQNQRGQRRGEGKQEAQGQQPKSDRPKKRRRRFKGPEKKAA